MSCSLQDSFKTKMDNKQDHVLVFATNKTMHERFTPKYQRSVFMLNNGYTTSFKNNILKGRIVFPNKKMKTNEIYSPFNNRNIVKNKKAESELIQLAKKRRMVLMPANLEHKHTVECVNGKRLPSYLEPNSFDSSTPKYDLTYGKYNFITKRFSGWNKRRIFSPFSLYRQNHYVQPSLYNWRRIQISKAQLDDEIDAYMAEVKLKPAPVSNEEDEIAFIQEYFKEAENFLQEKEIFHELCSD